MGLGLDQIMLIGKSLEIRKSILDLSPLFHHCPKEIIGITAQQNKLTCPLKAITSMISTSKNMKIVWISINKHIIHPAKILNSSFMSLIIKIFYMDLYRALNLDVGLFLKNTSMTLIMKLVHISWYRASLEHKGGCYFLRNTLK